MSIAYFLAAVSLAASLAGQATAPVKDFQRNVDQYLKVRKKACERVPKLDKKADPEQIAANERAQAEAIRAARADAAQGAIFTRPVAAYFRAVIRDYIKYSGGQPARKAAKQGNPAEEGGVRVPLKVNAKYPDNAPLSTFPPGLLLRLPELPKEIDYRFVGDHLVLYDAQAGIIIDFIPNAMR